MLTGTDLFLSDGAGGLERHLDHDILAVADAPLDPPRPVGGGPRGPRDGIHVEGVVVLDPAQQGAGEPVPALEPLGGGDAHARRRQGGLQFVEDGRAEAGRGGRRVPPGGGHGGRRSNGGHDAGVDGGEFWNVSYCATGQGGVLRGGTPPLT